MRDVIRYLCSQFFCLFKNKLLQTFFVICVYVGMFNKITNSVHLIFVGFEFGKKFAVIQRVL